MLLALMSGLILGIGYLMGGSSGLTTALLISLVMNLGSYWFSSKIVLSMHQAKEITPNQASDLYTLTKRLSDNAQIPMPKLYLYDSPTPNAFATGRNPENGVVAVSSGLLDIMNKDEIAGVIAHELAHIKNRDILTSTIVATFATAISYLTNLFMFIPMQSDEDGPNPFVAMAAMIVGPIVAMLIQMSVSRTREFAADETGARIAHSSSGLASALAKLESYTTIPTSRHDNNLQSASLSHMYIHSNLSGGGMMQLFSTHPSTEKRIARLKQLSL